VGEAVIEHVGKSESPIGDGSIARIEEANGSLVGEIHVVGAPVFLLATDVMNGSDVGEGDLDLVGL
jgi:hypothetical protein